MNDVTKERAVAPLASLVLEAIGQSGATAVVFDLFDTLLVRNVHPEDVKRIACDRIARHFGCDHGKDVYQARARIEAELCAANAAQGFDLEFQFEVMAERLVRKFAPGIDEAHVQRLVVLLMDTELSVEASVQRVDMEMRTLLQTLQEQGRKIFLLSDFYLSASALETLLHAHGLRESFDAIFVSCDTLQTKRSGNAYRRLLSATGLSPQALVMIGDNAESDVRQAKMHGLSAILLDRRTDVKRYRAAAAKFADISTVPQGVRKIMAAEGSGHSEVPFRELALTLYLFIHELHGRLVADRATDVFFLSREGQPLKRLFDQYQTKRQLQGKLFIRTHYFESSRRASFLPSLGPLETETFDSLFRQYRSISLLEFTLNLGFDDLVERFRAIIGASFDVRVADLPDSADFRVLVNHDEFKAAYAKRRNEQIRHLTGYLASFDVQAKSDTMHLVDVGWKGTIQDNLWQAIQHNIPDSPFRKVTGYYIGIVVSKRAFPTNRKYGLLFDAVDNHMAGYPVFNENKSLFEVLLAADHGSAKSYSETDTGKAFVECQFSAEEDQLYRQRILPIQRNLEARFARLSDFFIHHPIASQQLLQMALRGHARMVFAPTGAERQWFRFAYHLENFGVFELSRFGNHKRRLSLAAKVEFMLRLARTGRRSDLGFWPWFTLHEQALPPLPLIYRWFRQTQLRRFRKAWRPETISA